ncbi:MAG: ABC transporter permease [Actinomycetota bacterium]|nr:ABC transporter permease [Actinomycetota bacterium]
MSSLALTLRQVRYENKSFWRNPAAAFFTFAFPLMFLVIFNGVFGDNSQYYVPSIGAFSVITACYTNIAMGVAFAREEGVLKRKRGTPLPGVAYLLGKVLHSTLIALLLVAIVALTGRFFYDVVLPTSTLGAFVATLAVGAAAFCALGLAITAVVPNADAAPAVVNASILPLLFLSGVFFPTDDAPAWMTTIADVFPIKHYLEAMMSAFNPAGTNGWEGRDLMIVAVWGVVGLLLALRFFSWEPRR